MTRLARLTLLLGIVLSLAQPAAASAAAAPYPRYLPTCAPVVVIGVRGSGQDGPKDLPKRAAPPEPKADPVRTVVADLRTLAGPAGAANLSVMDLPYPAIPVELVNPEYYGYKYDGSRKQGESSLELYLNVLNVRCPTASFVLVGYSQGADVIGEQLPRLTAAVRAKIAGVALFGDPRFNAASRAVKGSFDPNRGGVRGGRPEFPSEVPVVSYCRYQDIVCQGPIGWELRQRGLMVDIVTVPGSVDAHMHYGEKEAHEAARWLHTRLTKRSLLTPAPVGPTALPLDVSFVIDSTGSMDSAIAAVRDNVAAIRAQLAAESTAFQASLTEYRDEPGEGDDFQARLDVDLTPDATLFGNALNALTAEGGGDTPESMFAGVNQGLSVTWRPNAAHAMILIADAAAKDPEPITGTTRASVIRRANLLGIPIHTMLVKDGSGREDLAALSAGTVGVAATSTDPSAVATTIVETLRSQAGRPIASASSAGTTMRARRLQAAAAPAPILGYPGVAVHLSAGTALSPLGDDLSYAWDFGDGQTVTTVNPVVSHTWAAPFNGDVTLTVTDSAGRASRVARPAVIAGAPPAAPLPPKHLRVHVKSGTLRVSWRAPRDMTPTAYRIVSGQTTLRSFIPRKAKRKYSIKIKRPTRCKALRIRVLAVDQLERTAPSKRARAVKVLPPRGDCRR